MRCGASGICPSAKAERCNACGHCSTFTVNQHVVCAENCQRVYRDIERNQHIAEWRAYKAGMQARGVTEKAYVEQCKTGGAMPSATAPEPKPTATAPTAPPSRPAPTATEAAPAPAPQKPAPTTTAAPAPAQQPSAPKGSATMEAGQFVDDASAKAQCPTDTVVWVNLPSKIYHFAGTKSYGTTKRGAYMCEKEAIAAEDRASKTEKHP